MSKVPNIEADETQDEMNSLKMHLTGAGAGHLHHAAGVTSIQMRGISSKVDSKFTTSKFPTNLE